MKTQRLSHLTKPPHALAFTLHARQVAPDFLSDYLGNRSLFISSSQPLRVNALSCTSFLITPSHTNGWRLLFKRSLHQPLLIITARRTRTRNTRHPMPTLYPLELARYIMATFVGKCSHTCFDVPNTFVCLAVGCI